MNERFRTRVLRLRRGGRSTIPAGFRFDDVVVREQGRWSSTPVGSNDVRTLDFAAVKRLGAQPPRHRDAGSSEREISVVAPVEPLAFPVQSDRLLIVPPGSANGVHVRADDLMVLDRVDRVRSCSDIAAELGTPLADVLASVVRLEEMGAIDVRPPGTPTEAERAVEIDPAEIIRAKSAPRPLGAWPLHPLDPERIPVVAVHIPRFGPPLAAGMILAHARIWEGGKLNDRYELRPLITIEEAESLLDGHTGPAVLLCSNYVWSYRENLALAERLCERNPELVVIHGGPHTPKYEADQERFMRLPGVHAAVIGEGETATAELLAALGDAPRFGDLSPLSHIAGALFRHPGTGELVRGPSRERSADLDDYPSPYLSGEFDHLHPGAWDPSLGTTTTFETNRGCPYKCSFCDWGSATMSRIRKFDMARVVAEMEWMAERALPVWMVTDANFGILPRDVEIAKHIVDLHRRTGMPQFWGVNTAKNTTRNLSKIISMLSDEGITVLSSLALQTRDENTLEIIDRENISTEKYDELAATFRRQRLPLLCDLIIGLPGATVGTFKADLQWCFDHEITPRAWVCQVLPNAPMNDPQYREKYELEFDEYDVVVSSSTFSRSDRELMMGLRMAHRLFEHLGLLRHVLRVLQWDRGVPALDVLDRVAQLTHDHPDRYPLVSWAMNHLDCMLMPPIGWKPFYAELQRLIEQEFDVAPGDDVDTAFAVQFALMPDRRRSFPAVVPLPHDYVAYYRDATAQLHRDGRATGPPRPLASYGPGSLEVWGDPANLSASFKRLYEERPPDLLPGEFWHITHFELDSPLTRWTSEVRATAGYTPSLHPADFEPFAEDAPDGPSRQTGPTPVAVTLQRGADSPADAV